MDGGCEGGRNDALEWNKAVQDERVGVTGAIGVVLRPDALGATVVLVLIIMVVDG